MRMTEEPRADGAPDEMVTIRPPIQVRAGFLADIRSAIEQTQLVLTAVRHASASCESIIREKDAMHFALGEFANDDTIDEDIGYGDLYTLWAEVSSLASAAMDIFPSEVNVPWYDAIELDRIEFALLDTDQDSATAEQLRFRRENALKRMAAAE